MEERKNQVLATIIKEYISTGQPVSSGVLVEKYCLDCSSATVRNEMAELEAAGLIYQPHTSAGRIPTEAAWNWYINQMVEARLEETAKNNLSKFWASGAETDLKQVAKALANLSGLAVFWVVNDHNVHYTGLSNLLSQPEFSAPELIHDMSLVIDSLDDIVNDGFSQLPIEPTAMLGEKSLFGPFSGAVAVKYDSGDNHGAFGIIGPMRMDYAKNLALLKHLIFLINKI